ncbi:MAG: malonic semialdehyde reductase [Betaproteobacteria bacterium]|nr:malonic semialdehyde reductase [Betaproteobacteria bacterium]MDE2124637.1 malonic semialdehyde reductase [Betaproteobacteria bacterium]MDE2187012.1 malonic semialdehyde reductase [Betaproteobacteria bacterium]MDE2324691.1 malonic semialdehyde reductase [Betaproteobacteria bacterium]
MQTLNDEARRLLFTEARTHNRFTPEPVPDALLRQLYDLMKWGPTSANCSPARLVFVKSPEAKAKLAPCMSEGNRDKTLQAPVNAIVGMDMAFYDKLPELFPHNLTAKSWFEGNPEFSASTAMRNSSLQGAYFMLAARGLGLDCGPMSGFNADAVNAAFFAGTSVKANFICNLGHGDPTGLFPRSPRLAFEQACRIA